jgi:hypothetical protein
LHNAEVFLRPRPADRNDWHVRFTAPGTNGVRRDSKWISNWIKDRTKMSYELRRYAGSTLLDLGATIFEVRDFLLHRDVQTTQAWHAYRL